MRPDVGRFIKVALAAISAVVVSAGTATGQGVGGGGATVLGDTVTVSGAYTESAPVAAGPSGGGGGGAPVSTGGGGGGRGAAAPAGPFDGQVTGDLGGGLGMLNPSLTGGGLGVTPFTPGAPAPAGPVAPPAPRIDWLAVARGIASQAAATIGIEAIDIGIVPEDVDGRVGLVGMPTWMWVENPSPATVGPLQKVVTSGPVTVTLNGTMMAVDWDMGDGGHQLCPGALAPFNAYTDVAGDSPSPTCGYRYSRSSLRQPGEKYQVTATSTWQVTWTATTPAGATGGVIPMARSSSTSIKVGENQVLVLPGKPGSR